VPLGTAQTKQLSSIGRSSYSWYRLRPIESDAPRLGRHPEVPEFHIKPLVAAQDSTTQMTCPVETCWPGSTERCLTVPARWAWISFSIFIASTMHTS
jgi:hypothetical protein